jgi:nucleolar protein 15
VHGPNSAHLVGERKKFPEVHELAFYTHHIRYTLLYTLKCLKMSADTKGKKRKSGDDVVPAAKKAKTSAPKNAPKPEAVKPLKSALKKKTPDIAAAPAKKPTKSTEPIPDPPKDEVALAKTETKKASKPAKTKASKSEPKAAEAPAPVDEEEDDNATELTADQTAALLAGFSSDEEEEEEDAGLDIAKIPAAPVPAKDKKKRASKGATDDDDSEHTPGTIYIGRLPHGFFERQLHAYYSQFGQIKNLRLARNKRTGKSQHHAFIEFASAAVADIVVKTMDKYLLFGHIMQVRRVPAEAVNEKMWKGGRSVKGGRVMPRNRIERSHLKRGAERAKWEERVERENSRRKEKSEKLKELGYEFEMPVVKAVSSVPVKPKAVEPAPEEGKVSEEVVESRVIDDLGPTVVEETTTLTEEEKPGVVSTTVKKTVKRKTKTAEAPPAKKSKKAKA